MSCGRREEFEAKHKVPTTVKGGSSSSSSSSSTSSSSSLSSSSSSNPPAGHTKSIPSSRLSHSSFTFTSNSSSSSSPPVKSTNTASPFSAYTDLPAEPTDLSLQQSRYTDRSILRVAMEAVVEANKKFTLSSELVNKVFDEVTTEEIKKLSMRRGTNEEENVTEEEIKSVMNQIKLDEIEASGAEQQRVIPVWPEAVSSSSSSSSSSLSGSSSYPPEGVINISETGGAIKKKVHEMANSVAQKAALKMYTVLKVDKLIGKAKLEGIKDVYLERRACYHTISTSYYDVVPTFVLADGTIIGIDGGIRRRNAAEIICSGPKFRDSKTQRRAAILKIMSDNERKRE